MNMVNWASEGGGGGNIGLQLLHYVKVRRDKIRGAQCTYSTTNSRGEVGGYCCCCDNNQPASSSVVHDDMSLKVSQACVEDGQWGLWFGPD